MASASTRICGRGSAPPRRHHHGRQWALGQRSGTSAHRGASGGRIRASRHDRRGHRRRSALSFRLHFLDGKLEALSRRGPLHHELRQRRFGSAHGAAEPVGSARALERARAETVEIGHSRFGARGRKNASKHHFGFGDVRELRGACGNRRCCALDRTRCCRGAFVAARGE